LLFSEKRMPQLIIISPIITIITLIFILLYSFINTQYQYYEQESKQLEYDYIKKQRILLIKEMDNVFKYIEYQKSLIFNNIKKDMQVEMKAFNQQVNKISTIDEYINVINQNKNENTEYIIYDYKNEKLIKNNTPFEEYKRIKNHKNIHEFFMIRNHNTAYYIKNKPKKELIIIIKKDITTKLNDLKKAISKWVGLKEVGSNNYFWIYSDTNELITQPPRKNKISKDNTNKININNHYMHKLVKLAVKSQNGNFFDFFYPREKTRMNKKRFSYVRLYPEWGWTVSIGISVKEIEDIIVKKRKLLEEKVNKHVINILFIALFSIIFISSISILISKRINKTLHIYKEKVKKKEQDMSELNKSLHIKIEKALKEEKEKDRAMLHQSRLARMGEMLSMISHQWRQPLNKLNSIMMELETKILFKKTTDEFLVSCVDDATTTIQFMSSSMEDFKNFYAPSRDKESFYLSTACNAAINLMQDSLSNTSVKLDFIIKKDTKVYGYKREYSQVILNIILNAKDALLSNKINKKKITLIIERKDKLSLLTIKDNAGGVNEDIIDLIFDPYFSTKKMQGTGLGLYMSKMIIEKNMQGKLSVRNDSFGAVFKILL